MDDNGVITVRDLRRRYGGPGGRSFEAVRGVTFSVRRGELFALLGTNGAGKTSTMEVLEGLAPPAQGAVRVLGCDPYRERALVRRRMGIMLQEGGFPPDLTVAETGRMWAGTLSAPRPVAEALGLVSLGHRAGVAVRSLSGGERRRLDLAMAILGRPEVLFLDEPTTGLDPESRRRTWLLIRELLGAGTTVRRRQRKGRGGMSAGTVTVSSSRQSSHRVAALARAEGILLWRNRLALLNAVILPAALVGSLKSFGSLGASGAHDFGAMLLTGLTAFALLIAVYYNLVTAMVARREELVLKRLRTGEATDGEILAGTAAPAIAIAWAQIAVAAVAAVAVLGLNPPANAALVPVALILGTAVFVLLAAVTAAVTRTVQLAQVTTMPALWLPLVFSGLLFPLAVLPEPLRWVAEALPLTPVVELLRLGLTGTTAAGGHHLGLAASFGAAAAPVLVLAA